MSAIFQYNEQQAAEADTGGGEYITESCVVRGFIDQAKWVESSRGAKGLELSFRSEKGQQVNYLTLYYQKKDGSVNEVGNNQIQAMMGCTGVKQLSNVNGGAPELTSKPIQLALERENYTKNNGDEGFRFQIKSFMSARSGKTIAEHLEGKDAETAEYWRKRFAENPGGKQAKQQGGGYANQSVASEYANSYMPPDDGMDDSIPF